MFSPLFITGKNTVDLYKHRPLLLTTFIFVLLCS
jgi:hypothetical protein